MITKTNIFLPYVVRSGATARGRRRGRTRAGTRARRRARERGRTRARARGRARARARGRARARARERARGRHARAHGRARARTREREREREREWSWEWARFVDDGCYANYFWRAHPPGFKRGEPWERLAGNGSPCSLLALLTLLTLLTRRPANAGYWPRVGPPSAALSVGAGGGEPATRARCSLQVSGTSACVTGVLPGFRRSMPRCSSNSAVISRC